MGEVISDRGLMGRFKVLARVDGLDLSSEQGRARERLRRVALTTLASAAAKAIAMAASLISVPLTLNYLGAERFGLWVTISSANVILEFADLGLGNGLLNVVATAGARGERELVRRYVSSASFLLLGLAIVISAGFILLSPLAPWARVFGESSRGLIPEARAACAAFAATFAASLPFGIVRRVQLGFQEGFASNLWQCLASVLSLAALLAGIRAGAGLPVLVLCLLGAPAVVLAANWAVEFFYRRRWMLPSPMLFDWGTGARLMRDGILFVTLQLAAPLSISAMDPLIATSYLGLAGAADFAVAQRLFLFIVPMQGMWLMPLWPAYGEAMARGDSAWMRRTLWRTTVLALALSAMVSGAMVVFRAQVFSAWLHRPWSPPLELAVPLALSVCVFSLGMATSMFLNGVNAIREQAGVAVLMTVVATALKIWFCRLYGVAGIPWGMLVGYTAVMAPFLVVVIRRRLAMLRY